MRPERNFIAERALALHCPELMRAAVPEGDLLPRVAALGEQFARRFAQALVSLTGGDVPGARCGDMRECTFADLKQDIGPLAANSLLAIPGTGASLLFSIEARAILRLIDRAFGGRGSVPAQLPEQFPVSGELLTAKLEALAVAALRGALGGADQLECRHRDSSIARLAPFADSTRLALVAIAVEEEATAWQATLAMPIDALPALFGGSGASSPARRTDAAGQLSLAAPFGELPLSLRAVLVDLRMPVSAISALVPGQVIPVAVARNVPLSIGERTLAHGSIGTMEDRVAVRITHSFQQQDFVS